MRFVLVICGLLAAALGVASPVAAADTDSLRLRANYDVDGSFNWGNRQVSVRTIADVTNTTSSPVSRIFFNLGALRMGHGHVGAVFVNNNSVTPSVSDQTISVPVSPALAAGAHTPVSISYTATMSTSTQGDYTEFAQTGGIMTAYRWIPWLSRPTKFDRPSVGEPWVTPVSPSVHVTLTSDRRLTYATSGRRIADNGLTQTFVASSVRDFNFSAAPDYKTASRTVRGTKITFYYRKMSPTAVLNTAAGSFNSFSSRIGAYPFSNLAIAEVMSGGDDIESPSLAFVAPSSSLLSWRVAHEVAHQWFYAVVGNDQPAQPFADEALADFIARDYVNSWAKPKCGTTANLDQSIYQLGSCYPWVIYVQGNLYLKAYRDQVGNTAFYRGLANYYSAYKYRIGGTRQAIDTIDHATGITFHHDRFPTLY